MKKAPTYQELLAKHAALLTEQAALLAEQAKLEQRIDYLEQMDGESAHPMHPLRPHGQSHRIRLQAVASSAPLRS